MMRHRIVRSPLVDRRLSWSLGLGREQNHDTFGPTSEPAGEIPLSRTAENVHGSGVNGPGHCVRQIRPETAPKRPENPLRTAT